MIFIQQLGAQSWSFRPQPAQAGFAQERLSFSQRCSGVFVGVLFESGSECSGFVWFVFGYVGTQCACPFLLQGLMPFSLSFTNSPPCAFQPLSVTNPHQSIVLAPIAPPTARKVTYRRCGLALPVNLKKPCSYYW